MGKKSRGLAKYSYLVLLLVLSIGLASSVLAADVDGDGSDTTDPNPDCDDTNASVLPPRLNLDIDRDIVFCNDNSPYTLNQNDAGGAMQLTASNVVLDCNGTTLQGTGTGIGDISSLTNITIKNCNFDYTILGIRLGGDADSTNGTTIANSTFTGSTIDQAIKLGEINEQNQDILIDNVTASGHRLNFDDDSTMDNVTIRNSVFKDFTSDGTATNINFIGNTINLEGTNGALFFANTPENVTFENNTVQGTGNSGQSTGISGCSGCSFIGNTFDDTNRVFLTNVSNSVVDGNIMTNMITSGFQFLGTNYNITFENNQLIVNTTGSIGFHTDFLGGLPSQNITIRNNVFNMSSSVFAGISIENILDVTITNNTIRDTSRGMYIQSSTSNVLINNNSILNATTFGFYLINSSNVSIINNSAEMISPGAVGTGLRLVDSLNNTINNTAFTSNRVQRVVVVNETSFGRIGYRGNITFNQEIFFNDVINISNNSIFTNASSAPMLNVSADLIFIGLGFTPNTSLVDFDDDGVFEDCSFARCSVRDFAANVAKFRVSSFTTYRAGQSACTVFSDGFIIDQNITLCTDNYFVNDEDNDGQIAWYNASNVYLNCNESNITGNSSSTVFTASDKTDVSVRNCNLFNYSTGVGFVNVNDSSVENMSIQDSASKGVSVSVLPTDYSFDFTLNNVTVINANTSMEMSNAANPKITNNNFSQFVDFGLYLAGGVTGALVGNNTADNSTKTAAACYGVQDGVSNSDMVIVNNTAEACDISFFINMVDNLTVQQNTIIATDGISVQGFRLDGISNAVVTDNTNAVGLSINPDQESATSNITVANNTYNPGPGGVRFSFSLISDGLSITNETFNGTYDIHDVNNSNIDDVTIREGNIAINASSNLILTGVSIRKNFDSGEILVLTDIYNISITNSLFNRSITEDTIDIDGADLLFFQNNNITNVLLADALTARDINNSDFLDLLFQGAISGIRNINLQLGNNNHFGNITITSASPIGVFANQSVNTTLTNISMSGITSTALGLFDSLQTTVSDTDFVSSATFRVVVINDTSSGTIAYNTTINFSTSQTLSDLINISNNFIRVNSTAANNLNESARLSLINLGFTPDAALVDLEDDGSFLNCTAPRCFAVNPSSDSIGFNITSFTTYSARNNSNDSFPPNLTVIEPVQNSVKNITTTIEIAANVTDDGSIHTVYANVTFPNGTLQQITLTNAGGSEEYNSTFSVPALLGVYNLTYFANDTGNNSNTTETSNFTAVDQIPPNVTLVSPAINTFASTSTSVVIAANVTDNLAIDTVIANVSLPNGTLQQLTLTNASGGVEYNTTFTIPPLMGVFTIRFIANDTSGNVNNSVFTNVTTLCVTPVNDMFVTIDTTLCSGTYPVNDSGFPGIVLMSGSDITLTCNSTIITGNSSGQGIADVRLATSGVTVGNCTLRDYNKGIALGLSSNSTVTNNTVQNSTSEGIFTGNTTNMTITLNTVSNASQALHVSSTTDAVIQENTLSSNTDGILVTSSTNATVINNQTGTTGTALHITNSLSTIVNRSLFGSSAVQDVVVLQRNPGTIRYNDTVNLTTGLQLSDAVTITNNFIRVNSTFAPQLNQSANITFASLSTAPELIQVDLNDSGSFVTCNATRCNQTTLGSSTARTVVTSFTTYRTFGTPPTGSTGGSGGSDGRPEPQPEQAPKDKEKDITCEPILTGDVNVKKAVRYRKNIYSGRIIINNICIDYLNYANFYSNSAQDERDIKFYDFKDYPTGIIPLDRPLFAVFDIGLSAQVDDRNLGFRVPIEWIEENNMQIEDVELMAYTRDWEVLPSVYLYNRMEGDKEWAHFESPLPSFSYMVIVGKKYGDLGINVQGDAVKEFGPKAEEPKGFWKDPKTYLWLLILLLVLGVCGTTGYYMYDRYKITGEIPTLKELFIVEDRVAKNAPKTGHMEEEMEGFLEDSNQNKGPGQGPSL